MTFTGKILVVLNLFLSFIFMAFAVMVFSSRENLQGKLKDKDKAIQAADAKAGAAATELKKAQDDMAAAKTTADQQLAAKEQEVNKYKAESKQFSDQLTAIRTQEGSLRSDSASIATELNQRRQEVDLLRDYRKKLLEENTNLVNVKTQLSDQLAQASNTLKLSTERNEQLLDRIQKLEAYAIKIKGSLPDNETLEGVAGVTAPPDVQGVVKRVDSEGKLLEITLGSDDGIRKGHVLEVWRTGANYKYLGRIKIVDVGHDHAVARPVASSGAAIQASDIVGPNILSANRAN